MAKKSVISTSASVWLPGFITEGQLTTRKWKDEKSGIDRYSTEIVLQGFSSVFKILSSKNSQIENLQDNRVEKSSLPNEENTTSSDLDDEIPF